MTNINSNYQYFPSVNVASYYKNNAEQIQNNTTNDSFEQVLDNTTPAFDVQTSTLGQAMLNDSKIKNSQKVQSKDNTTNIDDKIYSQAKEIVKNSELRTEDGRKPTISEESQLKQEVSKYQQTDRNVRTHEAAHMSVGGQFAGAASFTYKQGPDGRMYAVGGEVPLNMSEEKDPQKTLAKATQLQRAALAPADPSPQDLAVAASATAIAQKAASEISKEQTSHEGESNKINDTKAPNPSNQNIFSIYNANQPYTNKTSGQKIDIAS